MNDLQIFENPEFGSIRTLEEDGKILFCGKDIAKALGYSVPRKALFDHCKGVLKRNALTGGGEQEMSFIPESDVYRLITHSKLPEAQRFEKWVFEEVLPTIRRTGNYALAPAPSQEAKRLESMQKVQCILDILRGKLEQERKDAAYWQRVSRNLRQTVKTRQATISMWENVFRRILKGNIANMDELSESISSCHAQMVEAANQKLPGFEEMLKMLTAPEDA